MKNIIYVAILTFMLFFSFGQKAEAAAKTSGTKVNSDVEVVTVVAQITHELNLFGGGGWSISIRETSVSGGLFGGGGTRRLTTAEKKEALRKCLLGVATQVNNCNARFVGNSNNMYKSCMYLGESLREVPFFGNAIKNLVDRLKGCSSTREQMSVTKVSWCGGMNEDGVNGCHKKS